MFLNHDPHFLAAHGYKTIRGCRQAAINFTNKLPRGTKPTYVMVTRYYDDGKVDYINVAFLIPLTMHLARDLAEAKFYVIN